MGNYTGVLGNCTKCARKLYRMCYEIVVLKVMQHPHSAWNN